MRVDPLASRSPWFVFARSYRPSSLGQAAGGAGGAKLGSKIGGSSRLGHDRPPLPTKQGISLPDTSLNLAQLSRLPTGAAHPFNPAGSTRASQGMYASTPHAAPTPHQATPVSALRASARSERRHMARHARDSHDFQLIQAFFKREREHASSSFRYPWPTTESTTSAPESRTRSGTGGGWATVGGGESGSQLFLDMQGYDRWQRSYTSFLHPVV